MSRPRADDLIAGADDWAAFWNRLTGLPAAVQGDAFERLVQLLLQSLPEYKAKLRNVWRWRDVPTEVRVVHGLPARDEGIDLLAETFDGKLWAIQCKFHGNTQRAVTRHEIGTFVSLAAVAGLTHRVVAHTSARPIRKRSLIGTTVEISLDRFLALLPSDWALIAAAALGRSERPEPRLARPHQLPAVQAALQHYVERGQQRGRLVMPCGTGKSLTAFFIAEALDARTVLVAVPSLALIRQSLADWTREYIARGETPEWLCVCSDETVGGVESDSFMAGVYDLGIPTTTDPADVAAFLGAAGARGRRIVFTTYQSSRRVCEGAQAAGAGFDFAVLDEAHRTVGPRKKSFAALLHDDEIAIRRRLFMTATERVLRGENDDVLSMDDHEVYGDPFFQLSFKAAIELGVICDYCVMTVAVSDSTVQEAIAENHLLDLGEDHEPAEAEAVAAGIALKRVFHQHGVTHALSFHRSIRAADRFRRQQDRLNAVEALRPETENFHVSSRRSAGERVELLKRFAASRHAVMTNARCLTEGVDIPAIDCVLFAEPKQSVVDIVQAAGRALRRSEGKTRGVILLPLMVPEGMAWDEFAETTAFKEVARTLAALSMQDERIAEEFRAVTQGRLRRGAIVRIDGNVPVGVEMDLETFAAAVRTRLWQRVGRSNWRPFEQAREFARGLGLKSLREWQEECAQLKIPCDIPLGPDAVYKQWVSWGDWLGTGIIAPQLRQFRPFIEARSFVRGLKLRNHKDWAEFTKSGQLPPDIPAHPPRVYKDDGWKSLSDWLGTGRLSWKDVKFKSFEEARTVARSLGFRTQKEWVAHARAGKLPPDIPRDPNNAYKNKGWHRWGDWLGSGSIAARERVFRPFEEAREFARSLKLRNVKEWWKFVQTDALPDDIPASPEVSYRNKGWKGHSDWLGTNRMANAGRTYRRFSEAREFARGLRLSQSEWREFSKSGNLPDDVPSHPERVYRDMGWKGWADWMGGSKPRPRKQYMPFEEARAIVRTLRISSHRDWLAAYKCKTIPPGIPSAPDKAYENEGWDGWVDWLGNGGTPRNRKPHDED